MKIIFFGTPQFAVPTLELLFSSGHKILSTITAPDMKQGRGLKVKESPISKISRQLKLHTLKPTHLSNPNFIRKLQSFEADLFIVVAYKILPYEVFTMPKLGTINLHASLLPKYRGAAPIERAILNGETTTGLTTFKIEKNVDVGMIYLSKEIEIHDMNYGELHNKLSKNGSTLMLDTINGIKDRNISEYKQGDNYSLAPKINNSIDCKIDWSNNAETIICQIRAFSPHPGSFTLINNKRLKIFDATIDKSIKSKNKSILISNNKMYVGAKDYSISIKELQYEGRKRMRISQFVNGNPFNGNYYIDE